MSDSMETARLLLQPISLDDVDRLVELDSDPLVMKYLTGGRATPREETEARVGRTVGHRWIARERASGDFIGWFGLQPSSNSGSHGRAEAELGYRLKRQAWGNGYASEGTRRLLAHGFGERGLHRVWAQTMTVNAASRRVMEACGMRYVRTMHLEWPEVIEGSEFGDVEYEILSPDAIKQRTLAPGGSVT